MNCIEADNEMNVKPTRLDLLESRVSLLENIVLSKSGEYMNKIISCEKCHPKFDEDGIL